MNEQQTIDIADQADIELAGLALRFNFEVAAAQNNLQVTSAEIGRRLELRSAAASAEAGDPPE